MTWLRRNRWWLLALPLAVVLAVASAGYRVDDFWWSNGWHRAEAVAPVGRYATLRATVYSFDQKPAPVTMNVRLGSVTRIDGRPGSPRVGARLRLDFRAVDGKPAPYCTVFVVDTDGNRYDVIMLDDGSNPCPPPDGSPDDATAPARWSRDVAAAVPRKAKVASVWIGVTKPGYARFDLDPPRRAEDLPASKDQ